MSEDKDVIYFIESGRKRKGEKIECKLCRNDFIRRITPYPNQEKKIYCTRRCAGIASRDRVTVKCEVCSKKIERAKSKIKNSRHGIFFCGRKCKDFAQSIKGNCFLMAL